MCSLRYADSYDSNDSNAGSVPFSKKKRNISRKYLNFTIKCSLKLLRGYLDQFMDIRVITGKLKNQSARRKVITCSLRIAHIETYVSLQIVPS